jgi:hypothetical protein
MEPIREIEEAVVHGEDQIGDQAGHTAGQRPALELLVLDRDDRLSLEAAVRTVEAEDVAGQRRADEALLAVRVVQPAQLKRN